MCRCISKFVLKITSTCMMLVGLALMTIAIHVVVENSDGFLKDKKGFLYMLIGLGGALFLVSLIGLCLSRYKCALGTYAICMALAAALQCYVVYEVSVWSQDSEVSLQSTNSGF